MKRTRLVSIFGGLAIVCAAWVLGGCQFTCRDSFWDKDKKVIEVKP